MADKGIIEGKGRVDECLPGAKFRIILTELAENQLSKEDEKEVLNSLRKEEIKNSEDLLNIYPEYNKPKLLDWCFEHR